MYCKGHESACWLSIYINSSPTSVSCMAFHPSMSCTNCDVCCGEAIVVEFSHDGYRREERRPRARKVERANMKGWRPSFTKYMCRDGRPQMIKVRMKAHIAREDSSSPCFSWSAGTKTNRSFLKEESPKAPTCILTSELQCEISWPTGAPATDWPYHTGVLPETHTSWSVVALVRFRTQLFYAFGRGNTRCLQVECPLWASSDGRQFSMRRPAPPSCSN